MTQLAAFVKKEWMEQVRTGRLWLLLILFVLFGVMSPALAKMTPWMFEMMGDTLKEQGLSIGKMEVTAFTSWQQYYKNSFMLLLVPVVLFSGAVTGEYQKGTLIPVLTKGVSPGIVIAAKWIIQMVLWSICYGLAFGITWAYTAYYWDNGAVSHWLFAGFCVYLLGCWMIALLLAGSVFLKSGMSVLLFTGGVTAVSYFLGMIPKAAEWLPTRLMSAESLLNGSVGIEEFGKAVAVTCVTGALLLAGAMAGIGRKRV